MDELNAAPSSTEPTAEELAGIAMGTSATQPQEAGADASGESNGSALAADAGAQTSVSSGAAAPSSEAQSLSDAPVVAASGEPSSWTSADSQSSSGDDPNAGASAAADRALADMASAPPASTTGTSSPSGASSLDSLPGRIAHHLESIYQITVEHVRQLAAPAEVVKSELALEIDLLMHQLSNGMSVSDGRIVAKLAALRAKL